MKLFKDGWAAGLFLTICLALVVAPVSAQNADNDSVLIEVKDGVVYVDGKEVSRLENKDASVRFKSGNGQVSSMIYRGGADGAISVLNDGGALNDFFDMHGNRLTSGIDADYSARSGILSQKFNDIYRVAELAHANPEIAGMEREARNLAMQIRREEGDTSKLDAELDALLTRLFDEKLQAQQERVETMQENLTELESQLEQRRQDRRQIIDSRKRELIGERSRFDW